MNKKGKIFTELMCTVLFAKHTANYNRLFVINFDNRKNYQYMNTQFLFHAKFFIYLFLFSLKILNAQNITITSPNGGEYWTSPSIKTITWSGNVNSNAFVLYYSTNGGATWIELSSGLNGSGSYLWELPIVRSTECRVMINEPVLQIGDESNANFTIYAINLAPVITNVDFNMRNDGSKIVDIIYDVNDVDGQTMTITVAASSDMGATWDMPITQVTGAIGNGITNGTSKTIVWNAGEDVPNFYSHMVQIRITADDGYAFNACAGTQTVTYAGKTYNTIGIGFQCWLRENLNVGSMIQGYQNPSNNGYIEKYCYNNNGYNCDIYGGLYNWNEAMQYVTTPGTKGICPPGWHIPTVSEFQTLASAVGGDGNALKAVGQGSGSGVGTNMSGFGALLGGFYIKSSGSFNSLGNNANFISSIENSQEIFSFMRLPEHNNSIVFDVTYKSNGHSVRCLKD
jgi:uncharacterized protein (TIGR02145 family)